MDHTAFNLQRTPCLPLPRKRSPDGASIECSSLLIHRPREDERLSWPVGWPIADGLPTQVVTHQLQVERRTAKERWPETDVLPLSHADTCCLLLTLQFNCKTFSSSEEPRKFSLYGKVFVSHSSRETIPEAVDMIDVYWIVSWNDGRATSRWQLLHSQPQQHAGKNDRPHRL